MPRFDVSPAAPHELLPACRLLFADARAEHGRDLLADETSGLFVARAGGRVCGAALVRALPGALGVAWPPRGDSVEAEDAVTAAACAWLRDRGVKVCQAFAAAAERGGMAPLERHGFRHTTQLVFLSRHDSPRYDPPAPLTFVAVRLPFSADFRATLLATHEETRDCPELNAGRTEDELIAGFLSSVNGTAYLARHGERPVGVVMLEPIEEPALFGGAAELTYIGVVPGERGRGFGGELLKFAAAEACASWGVILNVSVDARNTPAMKLYARHGFVECDRGDVWLAAWPA